MLFRAGDRLPGEHKKFKINILLPRWHQYTQFTISGNCTTLIIRGAINPAQFWNKRPYYPQHVMDLYTNWLRTKSASRTRVRLLVSYRQKKPLKISGLKRGGGGESSIEHL